MSLTLWMDYTLEEKERCDKKCKEVIDLLTEISVKERWLVVNTLKESFPVEELKKYFKKDG